MAKSNTTQDAAVRLMLKFPFFSELYYTMTVYDDETIPTLCTDGRNLWVNPEFWATLSLDLKIAAVAHEIGHKMLLHSTRRGHRNPVLWNVAADYVVNAILKANGFTLDKGWLYDAKYEGMTTEAVYSELEKEVKREQEDGKSEKKGDSQGQPGKNSGPADGNSDPDDSGAGDGGDRSDSGQPQGDGQEGAGGNPSGGQPGAGAGAKPSPDLNIPGVSQDWKDKWQDIKELQGSKETIEKAERETIEQVQKAIVTARAHGSAPGGMTAFDDVCTPSREPWYNHLHRYMQSLSQAEYSWARINRRHLVQHSVFAPANYSEALENVVFAIDTSGSVFSAAAQANFAGHVNAILAEAKPKRTHVLYFDTRITRHDELDYGQLDFDTKPSGGGGTSFHPIFKFIEDEGLTPEVCIVLTDCMGDYPRDEPPYPVLWCSIMDPYELFGGYLPPFGDILYVDPNL